MIDPLKDGKSRISLVAHMGGDLDVVNDARASFEKESSRLTDGDIKLIRYLIAHQHTSPLRGTVFKFKVKAPLFVARQWWKHTVASAHTEEQLGWNEKSFRYVPIDDSGDFYVPQAFRMQSRNNKQATAGALDANKSSKADDLYRSMCDASFAAYSDLLKLGVGREQARGVLVPSVYTSWVWTASLQSVLHFVGLRRGGGAQQEITAYAGAVFKSINGIVPETIKAWEDVRNTRLAP